MVAITNDKKPFSEKTEDTLENKESEDAKGLDAAQIADILEEDVSVIEEMVKAIEKNI